MELEEKITKLEGRVTTLTGERDSLQAKFTEAEKAKRIAEAKSQIDNVISKAELPEPARVRLLEKFKDAETADGLEDAIKSEKDYVASLLEAGKVKGMGGHTDTKAGKEALRESVKRLRPEWTEAQIETFVEGQ